MSNIGIPKWVFQLQPRNSEAREPTSESCGKAFSNFYNLKTHANRIHKSFIHNSQKLPKVVGSLASEFLRWTWNSYVGIPMLDIGIPTSEFQCPT